MDYRDYQKGMSDDHFWLKAKLGLIDILLSKLAFNPNSKILNIGVGTGNDLEVIKKYGLVHAIDIDQKTLDIIPEDMVFEKKMADANNIPYPDNFFDIAVSFDVFEHIKNDSLAIKEVYRVLKKDGILVFTVPAFNFLFSSHDINLGHFRRYNKKTLKTLLVGYDCLTSGYWVSSLFIPAFITRFLSKKTNKLNNINFRFPKFLNSFCYKVLSFDNWAIKNKIKLPVGLSIYGIYKVNK